MSEPFKCPICGFFPSLKWADQIIGLESKRLFRFECCGIVGVAGTNEETAVKNWNDAVELFPNDSSKKVYRELLKSVHLMGKILLKGNDVEVRAKKDGIQVKETIKKIRYST